MLRSLWLALKRVDGIADTSMMIFSEFVSAFDRMIVDSVAPSPVLSRTGSSVALIQLGDLVDRGPDSAKCVMIIRVAKQVLGWTVFTLYGNHEVWSIMGVSTEFIHPTEISGFGDVHIRKAVFAPGGPLHIVMREEFLGMVRLSSVASGTGNMSISDPRNPNTLFVHGGVELDWLLTANMTGGVDDVNAKLHKAVASRRTLYPWMFPSSPLSTRELAQADEPDICGSMLERALAHYNVARIVVGHTPQDDQLVKTRCDGRIVLTDVMMSRWMMGVDTDGWPRSRGQPVAVIMHMNPEGLLDSIVAHYTDLITGTHDSKTVIFRQPPPPPQTPLAPEPAIAPPQAIVETRWTRVGIVLNLVRGIWRSTDFPFYR